MNNIKKISVSVIVIILFVVPVILFIGPRTPIVKDTTSFVDTSIEKQVQKLIVAGKLDEVPKDINKSKKLIINEYMRDCYLMKDDFESMKCFEFFYLNNNPEIETKSEECNQKTGERKDSCMDEYYMILTEYHGHIFCTGIKNAILKAKCLEDVE